MLRRMVATLSEKGLCEVRKKNAATIQPPVDRPHYKKYCFGWSGPVRSGSAATLREFFVSLVRLAQNNKTK